MTVDLDVLPVPDGVALGDWLACFPCFAFLLTCPPDRVGRLRCARSAAAGSPPRRSARSTTPGRSGSGAAAGRVDGVRPRPPRASPNLRALSPSAGVIASAIAIGWCGRPT